MHRQNAAEQAIQTWKGHCISILAGVSDDLPIQVWDELVPGAVVSLNLLRASNVTANVSAYAYHHGQFDYNRTPLAYRQVAHYNSTTSPTNAITQLHMAPYFHVITVSSLRESIFENWCVLVDSFEFDASQWLQRVNRVLLVMGKLTAPYCQMVFTQQAHPLRWLVTPARSMLGTMSNIIGIGKLPAMHAIQDPASVTE
jgi:hypothetical protein